MEHESIIYNYFAEFTRDRKVQMKMVKCEFHLNEFNNFDKDRPSDYMLIHDIIEVILALVPKADIIRNCNELTFYYINGNRKVEEKYSYIEGESFSFIKIAEKHSSF